MTSTTLPSITLRLACEHDSDDILRWRNDPDTVVASPTGSVDAAAHARWYQEKLHDPRCTIFIAEIIDEMHSSCSVGVVRFDRTDSSAEVSITINPAFRGKGHGKLVLRKALHNYFSSSEVHSIIAHIVEENTASIRLFTSLGFIQSGSLEKAGRRMHAMRLDKAAFVPLVSIIIRCYNSEKTIRAALHSALNQTYPRCEIVVVDDGSNDQTRSIITSFTKDIKVNLRVLLSAHVGPYEAAHIGLRESHGDYIVFLDGDDEFLPETVSSLARPLTDTPLGFSYCDYYEVPSNGIRKYISLCTIFNCIACGMMFKKSVLDDVGFWDSYFLLPEYDLVIRVMKKYKGYHVAEPLYVYHRYPGSMTADKGFIEQAKKQLFDKYGVIEGFKEY